MDKARGGRTTESYFKSTAIANGYPKDDALKTKFFPFLRLRATLNKVKGKTWAKKAMTNELHFDPFIETSLEEAIKTVKAAGYKVMKPINDWIEL